MVFLYFYLCNFISNFFIFLFVLKLRLAPCFASKLRRHSPLTLRPHCTSRHRPCLVWAKRLNSAFGLLEHCFSLINASWGPLTQYPYTYPFWRKICVCKGVLFIALFKSVSFGKIRVWDLIKLFFVRFKCIIARLIRQRIRHKIENIWCWIVIWFLNLAGSWIELPFGIVTATRCIHLCLLIMKYFAICVSCISLHASFMFSCCIEFMKLIIWLLVLIGWEASRCPWTLSKRFWRWSFCREFR